MSENQVFVLFKNLKSLISFSDKLQASGFKGFEVLKNKYHDDDFYCSIVKKDFDYCFWSEAVKSRYYLKLFNFCHNLSKLKEMAELTSYCEVQRYYHPFFSPGFVEPWLVAWVGDEVHIFDSHKKGEVVRIVFKNNILTYFIKVRYFMGCRIIEKRPYELHRQASIPKFYQHPKKSHFRYDNVKNLIAMEVIS